MKKYFLPVGVFIVISYLFFSIPRFANAQTFDLINFIARPEFPPHTISGGDIDEDISYTTEGGSGPGQAVRQKKGGNYEQFFIGGGGIYRREDTSWAPGGADAVCTNGNRAAYTLQDGACVTYSDGQTVPENSGAYWAPATGSTVGQSWNQGTHQIIPVDTSQLPSLTYCTLGTPAGQYDSPNACNQSPSLTVTGYFGSGEYTFCSGLTNPAPVVTLSGTSGAGAGDGFAYMEGCGLVGFTDESNRVGLIHGCGIPVDPDIKSSPNFTCSRTGVTPIAQCAPVDEQPPGVVSGFFRGLLSTFINVVFPPHNLTAECDGATDILRENPYPDDFDYNRPAGKPPCGAANNKIAGVTTITNLTARDDVTHPIIDRLPITRLFNRNADVGGYLVNHLSTHGAGDSNLTVRGYFEGCYKPECFQDRIDYMCNEDKPAHVREGIFQTAGVLRKMHPMDDCKSVTGEIKECEDAWRDRILAAVIRNWICDYNGNNCADERAADYIAGWLHIVDGAADINSPTWFTAHRFASPTRPHWVSEFVCMNPNFSVPGIDGGDIRDVCQNYLGINADGTLSPGGLFAQIYGENALRSCGEDCKYSKCGSWLLVPTSILDDVGGLGQICSIAAEDDPGVDEEVYRQLCSQGAISWPNGGRGSGADISNLISPPEVNARRDAAEAQVPQTHCVKATVNYPVADSMGKMRAGGEHFARKFFTLPDIFGVSDENVLQAADPPLPSPSMTTTAIERDGGVAIPVPEAFDQAKNEATDPETGIVPLMAPPEQAALFQTRIGGVPIAELPTGFDISYPDSDFVGTTDGATPIMGGVCKLYDCTGSANAPHSWLAQYISPPELTPPDASVSRWIKDLADGRIRTNEDIAALFWSDLLSLAHSGVEKEISRK